MMRQFLQQYRFSLILLGAVAIGGACGLYFGEDATIVRPFGDLFLNFMFMMIVPLVFFSISSAIATMNGMKRLGKIMGTMFAVFFVTAAIAGVLALFGSSLVPPLSETETASLQGELSSYTPEEANEEFNLLEELVQTVTVPDFADLFSRSNMLQLIVLSVFVGLATTAIGEQGKPFAQFLRSGQAVMMKIISYIMYYAPIGLGCYFAAIIGELGSQLLGGYLRVLLLYIGITAVYFFGFFTLYAYVASGKLGTKTFWKHAVAPSTTALATCSSAASIPVNLQAAKRMGVPKDIAETVIPLGANTHKDGSVIGGVLKIVFLFTLFGKEMASPTAVLSILAVAFLVGAVMGAIPGGGLVGEMLILSIFGFPPEALPLIAVISTIIDAPATLLNSCGNTVCSMLTARFVEGRQWLSTQRS
ncbi:Na+/H+-dicarboxylate symporter [Shouchella rhizosphaerae]|nr:Proton/sodium-glutamate symport protein [Shouchella clausii]SHK99892.1 Na+/H+-dicarboxylate symporter [Shouchella rhizosphaerae]